MARTTNGMNAGLIGVAGQITRVAALSALPSSQTTPILPAAGTAPVIAEIVFSISNTHTGRTNDFAPNPADISMPAGAAPLYLAYFNAAAAGNFGARTIFEIQPLGGRDRKYSFSGTANTIRSVGHGLAVGDRVVFYGSAGDVNAAPGLGLTAGVIYFVQSVPSADTFTLSDTAGGAVRALTTTAGSESAVMSRIVPQTFPEGGTLRITNAQLTSLL